MTFTPSSTARARLRRAAVAGTALLAVPTLLLSSPGAASAATTRDPAAAGAGWLGRQLGPDHLMQTSGFDDYGLTADVVLALDAAGVGRTKARQATRVLTRHVLDYTGFGDPTAFAAGSFAKLLNVAAAQGIKPNQFGTGPRHKLAFQLRRLECGGAAGRTCPAGDRGRFSDKGGQFGDFSNTFSQSLALIGLERTTAAGPSTASVGYLRRQQCPNGGFPEALSKPGCTPSVDATAFAVQALLATGACTGSGTRNTNTTGLAAQALDAAGREVAAREAGAFVRSLQVRCGGQPDNRGKVRYDAANSGDAIRASAQAVPALARVGIAELRGDRSARTLPRLAC